MSEITVVEEEILLALHKMACTCAVKGPLLREIIDELLALRRSHAELVRDAWQPIETAPKGGGAEMVADPAWVDPPEILLLFPPAKKAAAAQAVGVWDWYCAPGGNGHADVSAWICPASGDLLAMYYGEPTHWRPLPAPPALPKDSP